MHCQLLTSDPSRAPGCRLLRDPDIRAPLTLWLASRHADGPDTRIIHELQIPRPSARVDIAMINGRLAGFEIKSDVDSLSRLPRQKDAFSQIFEHMTLVVTRRHVANARQRIPSWWGLVEFDGAAFKIRRPARLNRALDIEKVLHVLTHSELLQVEAHVAGESRKKKRRKCIVIADLLGAHRRTAVLHAFRETLKLR